MNILTTGLSGLVGSRVQEVLQNECKFEDIHLNGHVPIQDHDVVMRRFQESTASYVLHLAAKADPDECEKEKASDVEHLKRSGIEVTNNIDVSKIKASEWKDITSAFTINVVGTKNIAEAARVTGKKLLYISTDYVFSGETKDIYTEESIPAPVNYYGLTKYWGEQVVSNICPDAIIARIAVPYGSHSTKKLDVVARLRQRLEKNESVSGIEDQSITPTFIDDIARGIKILFEKNYAGIVHVVGGSHLSPHEVALAIARVFNYDKHLITSAYMNDFYQNRARRPQYTNLSHDKLKNLGLTPHAFVEGLNKIKEQ